MGRYECKSSAFQVAQSLGGSIVHPSPTLPWLPLHGTRPNCKACPRYQENSLSTAVQSLRAWRSLQDLSREGLANDESRRETTYCERLNVL